MFFIQYKYITTSAVSLTNLGSILIFCKLCTRLDYTDRPSLLCFVNQNQPKLIHTYLVVLLLPITSKYVTVKLVRYYL